MRARFIAHRFACMKTATTPYGRVSASLADPMMGLSIIGQDSGPGEFGAH